MILVIQGKAAGRNDDYQQEAEMIHASPERIVCVVKSTGKVVEVDPKDIAGVRLSQQVKLEFPYQSVNKRIDIGTGLSPQPVYR